MSHETPQKAQKRENLKLSIDPFSTTSRRRFSIFNRNYMSFRKIISNKKYGKHDKLLCERKKNY